MPLISAGTALALGLITIGIIIWFLFAAIADGVKNVAKSLRGGRDAGAPPPAASLTGAPRSVRPVDVYLSAYEAWLDSGMEGDEPRPWVDANLGRLQPADDRKLQKLRTREQEMQAAQQEKKQPKPDVPPEERKERLVLRWREDIHEALARTKMYRPHLGDGRLSLEDYGLTLHGTVDERRTLYQECLNAFQSAHDAYERDYYQTHGRVPIHHTPAELLALEGNIFLDRPFPPRPEDFWLTPEDLQEASEGPSAPSQGK